MLRDEAGSLVQGSGLAIKPRLVRIGWKVPAPLAFKLGSAGEASGNVRIMKQRAPAIGERPPIFRTV